MDEQFQIIATHLPSRGVKVLVVMTIVAFLESFLRTESLSYNCKLIGVLVGDALFARLETIEVIGDTSSSS